jgi:hypothetical protein
LTALGATEIPPEEYMKNTRLILAFSLLSLSVVCINADTLTGNGSLQSWSPGVLGTGSGPYWNSNMSGDGSNYNIGWCMTGTGNCHIANPPGAINYYGNGTAAASNMSFTSAGTPDVATLLGTFSTQNGVPPSGLDIFGWYSVAGSTITTHQLFTSGAPIGTMATFTPTSSYGFYLENIQSPGASYEADYFWFMNDSLDYTAGPGAGLVDTGTQHFSVFSGANSSYYLGVEDAPAPGSDLDYNDVVVELQPAPEPASLAMMVGGMSLLGWAIRRRRA